jgi:hypothetical protein
MRYFLFLALTFSLKTLAHPVIYQDGLALSSSNMPDYSENYLFYSFTNRFSTGLNHWRFTHNDQNTEFALAKINHLLWRRNTEHSQANIYLHGGVGVVDQEWDNRGTREAYLGGIEADWETRSLYSSLKHYQFHTPAFLNLHTTQARVGFSPLMAGFKDLQTWFMLQAMHISDVQEKIMLTPMLRFFYHNVLWEIGSSTRGDWMLNLMVHY